MRKIKKVLAICVNICYIEGMIYEVYETLRNRIGLYKDVRVADGKMTIKHWNGAYAKDEYEEHEFVDPKDAAGEAEAYIAELIEDGYRKVYG